MNIDPSHIDYKCHAMSMDEAIEYRKKIGAFPIEPTDIEFALGMLAEQVDPLIRDAVFIFAGKGYFPIESCQGHEEASEQNKRYPYEPGTIIHIDGLENYFAPPTMTYIVSARNLSEEAQRFFLEEGLVLKVLKGHMPTDDDNPFTHLLIPHDTRTALEFMQYMTSLAENAPQLDAMLFICDMPAVEFRRKFGFNEDEIPPERYRSATHPNCRGIQLYRTIP